MVSPLSYSRLLYIKNLHRYIHSCLQNYHHVGNHKALYHTSPRISTYKLKLLNPQIDQYLNSELIEFQRQKSHNDTIVTQDYKKEQLIRLIQDFTKCREEVEELQDMKDSKLIVSIFCCNFQF